MHKVSVIVMGFWGSDGKWRENTETLNTLLNEGYEIISTAPMGGGGFGTTMTTSKVRKIGTETHIGNVISFASLVVLEKDLS
ncbi:hypothetical protein H3N56_01130 [Cetobacterium sp. 2A]|uniref:hypothetical protein n=1 Tax=unclassified Cetobacterium TaxID=2630983 RepID=UPI00163C2015|nr:hypothetical protein [Cetobacterium sp. 2A]MBC2855096.1 hypothetical protein [Cetobacterium sp. 2A]